jgi:hypothetical protein
VHTTILLVEDNPEDETALMSDSKHSCHTEFLQGSFRHSPQGTNQHPGRRTCLGVPEMKSWDAYLNKEVNRM